MGQTTLLEPNCESVVGQLSPHSTVPHYYYYYIAAAAAAVSCSERIPNGHSFNISHMEGIAGELKRSGITQNETKSGEGYSK